MTGSVQRPLKVGMGLPDAVGQMAGGTPRWSDLLAMATRAEEVGFDSLWLEDHLLFRLNDMPVEGPWECWTLLSALAAVTSKVEIGPLVACTSFRSPALLAKMADTVDEISDGRLILGLGAGWHEPEYQAFGFPFDHRVSRFEEALQIIHSLLRTGSVDFDGKYYQARECELLPRGPRPEGPPIWLGSTAPRMLGLLARYGDGWNTYFNRHQNNPANIAPLRDLVDAACVDAGRDPATVERTCAVLVSFEGDTSQPSSANPSGAPPLTGTPEEIATTLRGFAGEGISHVQVWLEPNNLAGVESFAPVLELLDQGV